MKNIFKPSAGWATPSGKNDFTRAVWLLTAYYTVGAFLILAVFNVMVYALFASSIRSEEDDAREEYSQQEDAREIEEAHIQEIQDDLANILLTSDAVILLLTLIVSYALSRRTLAPLEEAYQKQARFVADAAHELRTPLAAMQAGSEVMLRTQRTAGEYTRFIRDNLEEVRRLTALSNDLLFLARHERKSGASLSLIPLSQLCKRRVSAMQAYAQTKGISLTGTIEDGVHIAGSSDDITRLLDNLIKNAVDYNKPDGSVVVSLQKKNGGIRMSVEDSGIGISRGDIPRIFERFYKASASRTQSASGTGLGLAMVKEIVEAHHGSIAVRSAQGTGTTFEIALPAR